jgi:hypothetical protein
LAVSVDNRLGPATAVGYGAGAEREAATSPDPEAPSTDRLAVVGQVRWEVAAVSLLALLAVVITAAIAVAGARPRSRRG